MGRDEVEAGNVTVDHGALLLAFQHVLCEATYDFLLAKVTRYLSVGAVSASRAPLRIPQNMC